MQRDRVTFDRFRESQGAEVSPMLTFSGWRLSDESSGSNDVGTSDEGVTAATIEVSVAYQPNGAPDTELRQSEWAVELKREGGDWKLCTFDHISGDPGPVPVEPIFGS